MKKNITINLCGRLFNIDEDAYQLLNSYVGTLRNYFSRESDADDIVSDIEARISELFSELNSQGVEAITIDNVKDVINRIGRPEQFDDDGGDGMRRSSFTEEISDRVTEAVASATNYFRGKRLYRNPKDKMVSGVISGLAAYFRCDVTILRLVAVLLILLSHGVGLLVYIVMALVVPAAETPEQQLRMSGKPVNMSNLTDEVVMDVDTPPTPPNSGSSGINTLLDAIAKFIVICFKLFLGIIAVSLFFAGIGILVWILCVFFMPYNATQFFEWHTDVLLSQLYNQFVFFSISLLITLFTPVVAIIHYITAPKSVMPRIIALIVFVAALATTIVQGGIIEHCIYMYY